MYLLKNKNTSTRKNSAQESPDQVQQSTTPKFLLSQINTPRNFEPQMVSARPTTTRSNFKFHIPKRGLLADKQIQLAIELEEQRTIHQSPSQQPSPSRILRRKSSTSLLKESVIQHPYSIIPNILERKKVKLIHFINQTNNKSGNFFNTTIREKILPVKKQEIKIKQKSYLQSFVKTPVRQIVSPRDSFTEKENNYEYILRYSTRTLKGFMSSKPSKVNQDNYLIYPHIGRKAFSHFFTVCDGHGSNGHLVSSLIKNGFPLFINARREELESYPARALSGIFEQLHNKLLNHETIDSKYSGSTIVCVYMIHDQLFCANVGDSRAILGQLGDGQWTTKALSRDHKPTEFDEALRINSLGGRIECYVDPSGRHVGPKRVWLKNENVPGLAMSRSMGDQLAASVGVIHEPEIMVHKLTLNDMIIVMGSDGLFEYLSNQEIIEIVSKYYHKTEIEAASDELLKRAQQSWQMNSNIVDDITFILFFMNY